MPCSCAKFSPLAIYDASGAELPILPPPESVFVALTNIVYLCLGAFLLGTQNADGWLLVAMGFISTIYHLYPTREAQLIDRLFACALVFYFVRKYIYLSNNRFLLVAAAVSFSVGCVFLQWVDPKTAEQRREKLYIITHCAWHALSAFAVLLFLLSTRPNPPR